MYSRLTVSDRLAVSMYSRLTVSDRLAVLDIVTRMRLAKLLDSNDFEGNWQALAEGFHLDSLVPVIGAAASPTNALLDNLEVRYNESS